MLKELLLKDTQTRSKEIKNNKENYSYKANVNWLNAYYFCKDILKIKNNSWEKYFHFSFLLK